MSGRFIELWEAKDDRDGKETAPTLKWFPAKWGDVAMHTDYNTIYYDKTKQTKKLAREKLLTKRYGNTEGQWVPISSLLKPSVSFSGGDNI